MLGAGGLAREMRQLLNQAAADLEFGGFVFETGKPVPESPAIRVAGDDAWLARQQGRPDAPMVILGSGFPRARWNMLCSVQSMQFRVLSLVHPSAVVDRDEVVIGDGVAICAGVVATCNVVIGDGALININSTLGHDSRVGRCAVLNPGAFVSGSVEIGDGVLVGSGAVLLQGIRVGEGATIGAGAVVTRDVPPGETVVGVPARRRSP